MKPKACGAREVFGVEILTVTVLISTPRIVWFSVTQRGSYHRGVEAGDLGVVDFTAAVLWFVTG